MQTQDLKYTERLSKKVFWKKIFDVQRPYRLHIQSLKLGPVLEVGCGIGRNLINLGKRAGDIGIDHNPTSIQKCQQQGLTAFEPEEFANSPYAVKESFDCLLIAHVMEHLTEKESLGLLENYIPYIKKGGKIIIITPQEAGFSSDPTHVTMMDHDRTYNLLKLFCTTESAIKQYSFPFPRIAGYFFKYNENISIGIK